MEGGGEFNGKRMAEVACLLLFCCFCCGRRGGGEKKGVGSNKMKGCSRGREGGMGMGRMDGYSPKDQKKKLFSRVTVDGRAKGSQTLCQPPHSPYPHENRKQRQGEGNRGHKTTPRQPTTTTLRTHHAQTYAHMRTPLVLSLTRSRSLLPALPASETHTKDERGTGNGKTGSDRATDRGEGWDDEGTDAEKDEGRRVSKDKQRTRQPGSVWDMGEDAVVQPGCLSKPNKGEYGGQTSPCVICEA